MVMDAFYISSSFKIHPWAMLKQWDLKCLHSLHQLPKEHADKRLA